ncbi:hypothetical protein M0812_17385 [Anaeramoeba flamelloides]|uniref:Uncharacterized protein n=1 Tax=Anaeramoeba flamelloides TaxID=1746091 RepID=A0AAV7ZEL5_9EUKA|nr:hypothetical protein M0812_17385 [Anaeramoeba flamelloides]
MSKQNESKIDFETLQRHFVKVSKKLEQTEKELKQRNSQLGKAIKALKNQTQKAKELQTRLQRQKGEIVQFNEKEFELNESIVVEQDRNKILEEQNTKLIKHLQGLKKQKKDLENKLESAVRVSLEKIKKLEKEKTELARLVKKINNNNENKSNGNTKKLEEKNEENLLLFSKVKQLKMRIEKLKESDQQKTSLIDEFQTKIKKLVSNHKESQQKLKNDFEFLKRSFRSLEIEKKSLQIKNEELNDAHEDFRLEKENLANKYNEKIQNLEETISKNKNKQQNYTHKEKEDNVNREGGKELKEDLMKYKKKSKFLKQQLKILRDYQDTLKEKIEDQNKEKQKFQKKIQDLSSKKDSKIDNYPTNKIPQDVLKELNEIKKENSTLKSQLREKEEIIDTQKDLIQEQQDRQKENEEEKEREKENKEKKDMEKEKEEEERKEKENLLINKLYGKKEKIKELEKMQVDLQLVLKDQYQQTVSLKKTVQKENQIKDELTKKNEKLLLSIKELEEELLKNDDDVQTDNEELLLLNEEKHNQQIELKEKELNEIKYDNLKYLDEIQNLQKKNQNLQDLKNEFENTTNQLTKENKSLKSTQSKITKELKSFEQEMLEIEMDNQKLQQIEQELKNEIKNKDDNYSELENKITLINKVSDSLRIENKDLRNIESNLKNEILLLKNQKKKNSKNSNRIEEIEKEKKKIKEENKQLVEKTNIIKLQNQKLLMAVQILETEWNKSKQTIKEFEKKIKNSSNNSDLKKDLNLKKIKNYQKEIQILKEENLRIKQKIIINNNNNDENENENEKGNGKGKGKGKGNANKDEEEGGRKWKLKINELKLEKINIEKKYQKEISDLKRIIKLNNSNDNKNNGNELNSEISNYQQMNSLLIEKTELIQNLKDRFVEIQNEKTLKELEKKTQIQELTDKLERSEFNLKANHKQSTKLERDIEELELVFKDELEQLKEIVDDLKENFEKKNSKKKKKKKKIQILLEEMDYVQMKLNYEQQRSLLRQKESDYNSLSKMLNNKIQDLSQIKKNLENSKKKEQSLLEQIQLLDNRIKELKFEKEYVSKLLKDIVGSEVDLVKNKK